MVQLYAQLMDYVFKCVFVNTRFIFFSFLYRSGQNVHSTRGGQRLGISIQDRTGRTFFKIYVYKLVCQNQIQMPQVLTSITLCYFFSESMCLNIKTQVLQQWPSLIIVYFRNIIGSVNGIYQSFYQNESMNMCKLCQQCQTLKLIVRSCYSDPVVIHQFGHSTIACLINPPTTFSAPCGTQ